MSISRDDIINQLKSWLGKNEKDGSHREIIDLYNTQAKLPRGYKVKYTDEWCATCVTSAFLACDALELIYPECGCEEMIKGLKKMGIWLEDESITPERGDLVFFDWSDNGKGDNTGWADHVGVVVEANGYTFTAIEGNRGDAVSYRTYTVNQKTLRGFARPKYSPVSSKYYPAYTGTSKSIVDALNVLAIDSSFKFRGAIAKANNIKAYIGTATQNTKLLNLLKAGKLKRV